MHQISAIDNADDGFEEANSPVLIEDLVNDSLDDQKYPNQENSDKNPVFKSDPIQDTNNVSEPENLKVFENEDLNMSESEELTVITCLASYSKIAKTDQEIFRNKLSKIFNELNILDNARQVKGIEKYIVHAMARCHRIVSEMNVDQKKQFLADLYHEKLEPADLYNYIKFDDSVISGEGNE